ncbi:hypothetical protein [Mangrovimonas cancribranchiae]|uniref:Uncharacterized protein n=1 Tax=Mangrovimonas cancribranchiae TaxID=3080055 RepID=A0AAU6P606_9FLAO
METTVIVTASNPIELQQKLKAIEAVKNLSGKECSNLTKLANSDKARGYLKSDTKFGILSLGLK